MPEIVATLDSAELGNERSIWVRPPVSASGAKNLTIFLDAEFYRDRIGAGEVFARLRAQRRVADSWLVFVSHATVEDRWRECPCYSPFARFVVNELRPWLQARHPGIGAVERTTLVGLSYTGLAAVFVATAMSGAIQQVIAQSGSFWWNDSWLPRQFDGPPAPRSTAFYLDVGTRETQENVQHRPEVLQRVSQVAGVKAMADALRRSGHAVTAAEFPGAHDCADWKKALPAALEWALPSETDRRPMDQSKTTAVPWWRGDSGLVGVC